MRVLCSITFRYQRRKGKTTLLWLNLLQTDYIGWILFIFNHWKKNIKNWFANVCQNWITRIIMYIRKQFQVHNFGHHSFLTSSLAKVFGPLCSTENPGLTKMIFKEVDISIKFWLIISKTKIISWFGTLKNCIYLLRDICVSGLFKELVESET